MNRSEQIDQLAAALAKAQAEMPHPALGEPVKAGSYSYRYASLASVLSTVLPVLTKHGLSIAQSPGADERGPTLTTLLLHISGQWLQTDPLTLPVSRADAQGFGSALSYMRRYSLMALLGVVGAEDDDDGQAASKPAPVREKANGHKAPVPPASAPVKTPPPPPQDGAELDARLSAYDLKVSEAGICERGAVVEHVRTLGVANGQPKEFVRWAAGWLAWGMEQAKKFVAACKAGRGPIRAGGAS